MGDSWEVASVLEWESWLLWSSRRELAGLRFGLGVLDWSAVGFLRPGVAHFDVDASGLQAELIGGGAELGRISWPRYDAGALELANVAVHRVFGQTDSTRDAAKRRYDDDASA